MLHYVTWFPKQPPTAGTGQAARYLLSGGTAGRPKQNAVPHGVSFYNFAAQVLGKLSQPKFRTTAQHARESSAGVYVWGYSVPPFSVTLPVHLYAQDGRSYRAWHACISVGAQVLKTLLQAVTPLG